jgi:5-(carboxyamino)imidazole ribonucleotide mutase
MTMQPKKIAVILGSKSDQEELKSGFELFREFAIGYSLEIISAHRNPEGLRKFCLTAQKQGVEVIIACAGMAAALPGFIASYTDIPVIGVAMKGGLLDGLDALLSMVSTPKGIGLVSSGIGKPAFINAIIVALEILALKDRKYSAILAKLKKKFK